MTTTIATEHTTPHDVIAGAEADTTAQHHPHRWGLRRAGMTNVWFYYDNEFDISGGRLLIRGTNGSGKSRALEMLLPFLLDAERRKIDATGSNKVTLPELMKAGSLGVGNRVGYLWIELERTLDDTNVLDAVRIQEGLAREWLTIGAHVKYSSSTNNVEVSYFTTPLRVGHDLHLMTGNEPLSRDRLIEIVGSDQVTDQAGHRAVIRTQVFGLSGEGGEERYKGLLQLLHTLRQPDVGNRIEEGRLAQILSDALPPLSDTSISAAGEQLDTLSETRQAQERLEDGLTHVTTFLDTYQRYTAARIAERATDAVTAARAVTTADRDAAKKRDEHQRLGAEREATRLAISELEGKIDGLDGTIAGIKALDIYKAIEQLDSRRATVAALGRTAEAALKTAADTRVREGKAAINADKVALEVVRKAKYANTVLAKLRSAIEQTQMPHGVLGALPAAIEAHMVAQPQSSSTIRLCLDTPPETLETPTPAILTVTPPNLDEVTSAASAINKATAKRARLAQGRAEEARMVEKLKEAADDAEQKATDTEIHRDDVAKIAGELQESLARSVAAYTEDRKSVV